MLDPNKAPLNACIFEQGCEVTFAKTDDEKEAGRFRIVAYSGRIMTDHCFWGNVAFDLSGLKFDKKKTAVLENHFSDKRIGYTTSQEISDKVLVEGKFLSNPDAQQVKSDIAEGFPMQASLRVPPQLIEHVRQGESVEVNGQILKGPGTVFRKATIREVSMCAIGTDSHTQSKTFAPGGEQEIQFNVIERDNIMAEKKEKTELTAETFAAEHPDLFGQVTAAAKAEGKTEGESAEKERFSKIRELAPDDPAFCVEQFAAGKTIDEAKTALIGRLQKQKAEAAARAPEKKVDPAAQEFSDEQTKTGKSTETPKTPKERYTEEFNASTDIQTEFGGAEGLNDYIAFRVNEDAGLAKTSSNK